MFVMWLVFNVFIIFVIDFTKTVGKKKKKIICEGKCLV